MMPFGPCPLCEGKLAQRDVEKYLHSGGRSAVQRVQAKEVFAVVSDFARDARTLLQRLQQRGESDA